MGRLTLDLAEFVATLAFHRIPPSCLDVAEVGISDCIGVMIAGADEEAVRLVARLVQPAAGEDVAPEISTGRRLAPPDAALVNAVAAHALDYDDVAIDGHPSTVLAPALLAEGAALGAAGKDVLAAYVAGYELWALLEEIEPGQLHERGFHPTAVSGAVAVGAACARLRGLDTERTAHAIAVSASLASGLVANFGTMTKPLHAGRAAQSGVLAARLAASGFTAATDALEHPSGFVRAHSPSGRPELDREDWQLGRDWRLERNGIHIKRYPTCYATHRSIDAMLDLVEGHDLEPAAVAEVSVEIGRTQRLMLRNRAPQTGLEAKFSLEFAMASALVARRVGLGELTDAFVTQPAVQTVMTRVRCKTTDETMPGLPFAPADRVSVKLTNGRALKHEPVRHARGSWQNPMSRGEAREKFLDCCDGRLPRDEAEKLFERLRELRHEPSLCMLAIARNP